jgi:hypothetical protein
MTPRLKPGFYVRAVIRRAEAAGAHAYLTKKGSEEAGAVYLSILGPGGAQTVLSQAYRGDGERVWLRPLGEICDGERARAYFEKQMRLDPDLWILEIEDREGRSFVDEPIV